eukprot:jgi/Bigna1/75949/fgenesh1_pg.38_\
MRVFKRKYGQNLLHKVARFFAPHTKLEEEMSPALLRASLTSFASNSSVCYALMSGVSAAALLGQTLTGSHMLREEQEEHKAKDTPGKKAQDDSGRSWESWMANLDVKDVAKTLVTPLYIFSFYSNLQGLMCSQNVLGHMNAVPCALLPTFVARHAATVALTGWLMAPAVATLSAAMLCTIEINYGHPASTFGAALFIAMGIFTTGSTFSLLRSNFILRKKHLPAISKRKPQPSDVAEGG